MLQYYIVSGILLVLHITDFAAAAPALVAEKRQAGVDVVHVPEDTITMLGKRVPMGDELKAYKLFLSKLEKASSSFDGHLAGPEAHTAKPSPNPRPSNQGPPNLGPSNPGSSNPGPFNTGPSNPGPPNLGTSNPGPPNPGPPNTRPSNPESSNQWPSDEWKTEPDPKRPKVRWFIGRQTQS